MLLQVCSIILACKFVVLTMFSLLFIFFFCFVLLVFSLVVVEVTRILITCFQLVTNNGTKMYGMSYGLYTFSGWIIKTP